MVAVTLPRSEEDASAEARRQKFTPWYPLTRRVTSRRGRRIVHIEPLFPNYLFVEANVAWRELFRLRGLRRLLMSGDAPVVVDLDDFRHRCDRRGFFQGWEKDRFRKGQTVTATRGAFAGVEGKYDHADDKSETALFEFLGVERQITFRHGDLKAVV